MDNEHYENHKGYKMDVKLRSYIEDGILLIGMAGTGKSKIWSESQCVLEKQTTRSQFSWQHARHTKHVK